MENNQSAPTSSQLSNLPNALIAGVIAGVLALLQLFVGVFNAFSVLGFLAYGFVAAMLIMKRRDILTVAAFGVLAFINLISLCTSLSYMFYFSGFLGFILLLVGLIEFVAYAAMACLMLVVFTDYLPQLKETLTKLWFAPAAILAVLMILNLLISLFSWYYGIGFMGFLSTLLVVACMLFSAMWAVFPNGNVQFALPAAANSANNAQKNTTAANNSAHSANTGNAAAGGAAPAQRDAYCSLVKHILLLLFTFGIWLLIWVYRTTDYLNRVEGAPYRNPVTKLLLFIFVPFYFIYWYYKTAQLTDRLANSRGLHSDLSTLCLILAIFVAIIPPILLQDKINSIVEAEKSGGYAQQAQSQQAQQQAWQQYRAQQAQTQAQASSSAQNVAEQLKTYKDLADSGVITAEEYEAKKKQLLGL